MAGPDIDGRFGKYRLLDRIATGGMAEIYRARYQAAAGVTKPVVIKKILPAFSGNSGFVSMFINEARIAVGLSHGNIAQVFDFGEIDGEYFIAMEYVHGQALSKVLKRARATGLPVLPIPYACLVGVELCKGLHYAHTRVGERGEPLGIIHRDVSPQNILLSYEGQVKIVDFGIAKARHASATETETGAVKGKYVYFSPEQARGKELDARSDVFAAGVVLYEALCGRLPFEGKMVEVMGRIVRGDFDRPRTVNASLPEALEQILLTALSTDRNTRYHSAQELGDALSAFLAAHYPAVSTSSLGHLMSLLFEKELTAEGLPVRIPREFRRELDALRGAPPARGDDDRTVSDEERLPSAPRRPPSREHARASRSTEETTAEGSRRRGTTPPRGDTAATAPLRRSGASSPGSPPDEGANAAATSGRAPSGNHTAAPPGAASGAAVQVIGRPPRWMYLAVPLIAAVLAMLAVVLVSFRDASAVVTSSPPGARVFVDGRALSQPTPAVVDGLEPERPHSVRVVTEGALPFEQQINPAAGETVRIHADFQAGATARGTAP